MKNKLTKKKTVVFPVVTPGTASATSVHMETMLVDLWSFFAGKKHPGVQEFKT